MPSVFEFLFHVQFTGSIPVLTNFFSDSFRPALINSPNCTGHELKLENCTSLSTSACTSQMDVGVICQSEIEYVDYDCALVGCMCTIIISRKQEGVLNYVLTCDCTDRSKIAVHYWQDRNSIVVAGPIHITPLVQMNVIKHFNQKSCS